MNPAAFLQRMFDDCRPTLNILKRLCVGVWVIAFVALCAFSACAIVFSMQCLFDILLEVGVASNLEGLSHHF